MNFLQLLFHLNLEKYTFSALSVKELIKIEKIILAEKTISDNIDNYDCEKLLLAIKKYPKKLDQLLKKNAFLLMFTGEEKIPSVSNNSSLADETEIDFFNEILREDFELAFYRRMAKNDYKSLNNLMQYSKMFSFEFLYEIENKLTEKIRSANRFFRDKNFRDTKDFNFIKHSAFFGLISHFPNEDVENSILSLYNKIVDAFNEFKHRPAKFTVECLITFSFFKTSNESFAKILKDNKIIGLGTLKSKEFAFNNKPKKQSILNKIFNVLSWIFYTLLFILILFGMITDKGSNVGDIVKIEEPEGFLEKVYFKTENSFYDYLTNVDSSIINIEKLDTLSIETGKNVFDKSLFEFNLIKNYKEILLNNDTELDLILLEYNLTNSLPNYNNSYYIPKKDSFKIKYSWNNQFSTNFNYVFYVGNNLANFKLNSENGSKNYLKNDENTSETRFLTIYPFTRKLMNHHFRFFNNVIISQENDLFVINSDSIEVYKNVNLLKELEMDLKFKISNY